MKMILRLVLAATLVTASHAAAPIQKGSTDKKSERPQTAQSLDLDKYIDVNKLMMIVSNNGAFGFEQTGSFGTDGGLVYPYSTIEAVFDGSIANTVVFASGVWLGATDSASGDTLVTVAEFSHEYLPGNMTDDPFDSTGITDPVYRVYKIDADSLASNPNADYTNWPVDQGAPVDSAGNPLISGDQMLWCVYNDANPEAHTTDAGYTAPLGVEIQQSVFGFNREDPLGNMVFIRFKILNKGDKTLENMLLSLWCDPDLGGFTDDLVGCDTLLSLGFCYNATNNDSKYGSRPPSVGYDFFQGPLDSTGDPADTAKMWGVRYPGFRNLPMSSFNKYINGTDPHSFTETYRFQNGLDGDGNPLNPPNFAVPGDPVTGEGDLDTDEADRRFMMTTGPFTFRPGDSTEIIAAIIVGQGADRKTSISALKYYDRFAQTAYELDFDLPEPPAPPVVNATSASNRVVLTWGAESEDDPGDYAFEGYSIYQGESPNGPWQRLANYDLNNGIATIYDEVFDINEGVLNVNAVKFGADNGLKRDFVVLEDALKGGTLVNHTPYFFRVEAYAYDETQTPKTITSATNVTVTPMEPPADLEPGQVSGDTVTVTHVGVSDGIVTPIVIDPLDLTGDTYIVTFSTDSVLGEVWHLINETTGDTLRANQTNQTGDNDYLAVDGILVKVSGPAVDFKNFEVVANANGPVDPPAGGSFGFQGFPSIDPDETQQSDGSLWGIHTGDNGGTLDGGTRGSYTAFFSRCTRDGANFVEIGSYDFEVRFTGDVSTPNVNGSYAYNAFTDGATVWVPFEIWNIGIGTPDDPSDDYQLVPYLNDVAGDDLFSLEAWGSSANGGGPGGFEHSFSGGDNDPFTDWVYWMRPDNTTPGTAGYDAAEVELLASTYDGSREHEVLARQVFGQWNGGSDDTSFVSEMPEQGTIFRVSTTKPNSSSDVFRFTAPQPAAASGNERLANVRVVPNPYYLYSSYDPGTYNRELKFTNLPTKCTITIFNIAGERIATLEKDSPESEWPWNVENRFGVPLASGVYLYVVEAEGMGQKIGKMAIFTEAEQLDRY